MKISFVTSCRLPHGSNNQFPASNFQQRFPASSGRTDSRGQIFIRHTFRNDKTCCLRILRD